MPKRKRKSPVSQRAIVTLAGLALLLFALGEGYLLLRSDRGQLAAARWLPWGDEARVTLLVGRLLRQGLAAAGVPGDSIHEQGSPDEPRATGVTALGSRVRWRVGLRSDLSLLQTNYAITRTLAATGIEVLSGRERIGARGDPEVVLQVGTKQAVTHEVVLSRLPPGRDQRAPETSARLAVVMFGFADDPELLATFESLPAPFAVALAPDGKHSAAMIREARARGREVVLHVPLEPINYPQVNPGPGTILVSMNPAQITGLMRRYLDRAGPVAAVANHMGSLATQDMTVMSAVYRELHRQRVPFLHVSPAAGAVCKPLAASLGVAYAEPDAAIDGEARTARPALLDKRWKEVLAETRARGHAVVMVRATPLTRTWITRALDVRRLAGVSVVPLSALLRRPAM